MSELIDRENAKDKFCEHCDERVLFGLDVDECREKLGCALMRWLDKVEAVEAEPVRHGRWIHDETGANYCSECNEYPYDDGEFHLVWHTNYCPHCGAKMDGEEHSDEP